MRSRPATPRKAAIEAKTYPNPTRERRLRLNPTLTQKPKPRPTRRPRPPTRLPPQPNRAGPKTLSLGPPAMAGLFRSGDQRECPRTSTTSPTALRAPPRPYAANICQNGIRRGRYWVVGDLRNTPGRSLFVRIRGADTGKGAAGKWTDMATSEHGDLLDIIQERCGLRDFGDVIREARRFLNLPRPEPTLADERTPLWMPRGSGMPRASAHSARRLFAASRPISGSE